MFELNGGEFRIIDRYEVGQTLGMNLSQTDETVKQLCDIGMIEQIEDGRKIILTQEALAVIDRSKNSN